MTERREDNVISEEMTERREDNVISEKLVKVFGDRLDALEESVQVLREQLVVNTKITQEVADGTRDVISAWAEGRRAFKLFNDIADGIRWFFKKVVLPVAILLAALVAWKTGVVPGWLAKVAAVAQ